eukprot:Gregarina_sp_Poly_1__7663@NODE_430_length_8539_cov_26_113314_g351_i0_p2_GENE_NODE_430_length_8539_cov_26_113314_g351_i0NODE_430_length_8539_cov_26_113314_g351_i0_p2_ORF_typecomplete_len126_score14_61_NODE_430_length_8539_cov_26_113314_g351_i013811758
MLERQGFPQNDHGTMGDYTPTIFDDPGSSTRETCLKLTDSNISSSAAYKPVNLTTLEIFWSSSKRQTLVTHGSTLQAHQFQSQNPPIFKMATPSKFDVSSIPGMLPGETNCQGIPVLLQRNKFYY